MFERHRQSFPRASRFRRTALRSPALGVGGGGVARSLDSWAIRCHPLQVRQTHTVGFKLAFDDLGLVIMEGRALRLFNACDLHGTGTIGISELEVALMIHDVVPKTSYLTPLESFNTFDLDGGGDISWLEFKVRTKLADCLVLQNNAGFALGSILLRAPSRQCSSN